MTNTIRHTVLWPRIPWRKDTYSFINLKPKITTLKTNHLWRARGSSPNENSVNRKKCKIIKLWWRNTKLLTNCTILCYCPQLLSSVWLFQTWLPGSFADCSLPGSSVHGIFKARLTGVGCHFLLQGFLPAQGLNPCLLSFLNWQVHSLPLAPPGKPTYNL